jgi:hypothetical protein
VEGARERRGGGRPPTRMGLGRGGGLADGTGERTGGRSDGENERERKMRVGVWGCRGTNLQCFAGMESAWARCEARFELRSRAWLRAIFCMTSAVLR